MPTTPNEINCGEKILGVLLVRLTLYASFLVVEDKRSPPKATLSSMNRVSDEICGLRSTLLMEKL